MIESSGPHLDALHSGGALKSHDGAFVGSPMEVDMESLATTASAVQGLAVVMNRQLQEWDTINAGANLQGYPACQTGGYNGSRKAELKKFCALI